MEIIITSIIFLLFANLMNFALMHDYSYVTNLKHYFRFNEYIFIKYNLIWIGLTFIIYLLSNLPKFIQ
jgi:hypothetical protein